MYVISILVCNIKGVILFGSYSVIYALIFHHDIYVANNYFEGNNNKIEGRTRVIAIALERVLYVEYSMRSVVKRPMSTVDNVINWKCYSSPPPPPPPPPLKEKNIDGTVVWSLPTE